MRLDYTAVELGFDAQPLASTAVYITGRVFALGSFEIAEKVVFKSKSLIRVNGKGAVAVKRHRETVNKTEVVCVAPAVAQQTCQSAVLGVCHAPLTVTVGIVGQGRAFSVNGIGEAVH